MIIYLYVKRHRKTGLLYFGKTCRKCPYAYLGSGKYWRRHLKVHGADVETLHVWTFNDSQSCSAFALEYSTKNQIALSPNWANLKAENGLDGNPIGYNGMQGKKRKSPSLETRLKISASLPKKRKPRSEETKRRISKAMQGSRNPNYGKPLSDEAKANISKHQRGKVLSDETRQKISKARLAKSVRA